MIKCIVSLSYLEAALKIDVHRIVLLAGRGDLQSRRICVVARGSNVVLLIHQRLVDLEGLHLRHCLRVALALSWLRPLLFVLPHSCDLCLQIGTVLVHIRYFLLPSSNC